MIILKIEEVKRSHRCSRCEKELLKGQYRVHLNRYDYYSENMCLKCGLDDERINGLIRELKLTMMDTRWNIKKLKYFKKNTLADKKIKRQMILESL